MISLSGETFALLNAVVARVQKNENHKWTSDKAFEEIEVVLGCLISVYDLGPRDERKRYVRFDWGTSNIEVQVGPQPILVNTDNRPEDDDLPPGTPIALAA